YETLDAEEITQIISGNELKRPRPEPRASGLQPKTEKKEKEKKKILEALEGLGKIETEPGKA
ncbi:MAG: hypothetical protein ACK4N5_25740, partial [Myxococcales bacterium]